MLDGELVECDDFEQAGRRLGKFTGAGPRCDHNFGRVGVGLSTTDELVDLLDDPASYGGAADLIESVEHDEAGHPFKDVLHRLRIGGDAPAFVRHQVRKEALDGRLLPFARRGLALLTVLIVVPHVAAGEPERVVAQVQPDGEPWLIQLG